MKKTCVDSLEGIPRQQTNPSRWDGKGWDKFLITLKAKNIDICVQKAALSIYITDSGGMALSLPHGVFVARTAKEISEIMKAAQTCQVPVTIRGGGLTTEGESVAFGGPLLDIKGMSRVLAIRSE